MAATALLAAERHRRRTGTGQHVLLSLEDVALAAMANLGFIAEAQLGHRRERAGNFLFGAFGGDFVCASGERVMVVGPLNFPEGGRIDPLPASRRGQHTDEVLGDLLGLDSAAIGRLHDRGVIAGPSVA